MPSSRKALTEGLQAARRRSLRRDGGQPIFKKSTMSEGTSVVVFSLPEDSDWIHLARRQRRS